MEIRIVQIPQGEAPLWVREKWLGMILPLEFQQYCPVKYPAIGVLSGSNWLGLALWRIREFFGLSDEITGYLVNARVAVELVSKTSPEAGQWWVENCHHILTTDDSFLFSEKECELVATDLCAANDISTS